MKKLYLTQGQVALVDDADWEVYSQWTWCAHKRSGVGYDAVRSIRVQGKKIQLKLSREILGLTDPMVYAEHKNGNTLDNQRANLRPATNAQNQANTGLNSRNTTGLKGVSFTPTRTSPKKWQARIRFGGKRVHVGWFATPEEAATAYRQKAKELYGEFVR